MSLRLLPAIIMDNEEDDDAVPIQGHPEDTVVHSDATRSQLDAMKLNRLHAATMAPSPSHIKTREEKGEVRSHQRARRASSDDNSRPKSAIPENRITTIPELTESFEKRLCVRDKRTISLNDDEKLCLICHEDMRKSGGVQELHCTHRFHKEAARKLEQVRPRSGSEAATSQARRLSDERRRSVDGPITVEKEQHTPLHGAVAVEKTDVSYMSCPRDHADAPLLVIIPHQSPVRVLHLHLPCCIPM
ncbi:hypothetical protein INR49_008513 [Caranx melampygus]|nr:hypothetical protein INR49_008513 [Caranx melampygus]